MPCVTTNVESTKVSVFEKYAIEVESFPPRVSNATKARRSQSNSNKMNDKTLPANSVPEKKVKDHHRKNKSKLSKKNRVDSSTSVRRTVFNTNSNSLCKTCAQCPLTRNTKPKVVLVKQWKPTGRLILLGGQCPLGRPTALNRGRTDRPLVFRLRLLKTYDWRSLMDKEFHEKVYWECQILKRSFCRGMNLYTISDQDMIRSSPICLLSKASKHKSWLWHRHLNYLNFGTLYDLARKYLVRGLPRLKFKNDHLCSTCKLGKSRKATDKPKMVKTIMEVLHTLHRDLCGPMRVQSINGKKYILVIVDDYSRFTWVKFLRSKDETPEFVVKLLKQLQVGLNKTVRNVHTNNGIEFVNKDLTAYYESVGITHEKTIPRTP
ncbi:retrovirus-related pol polyprotein from transposon TNT 1-94 [Tanacetum coccineum]|uniref:Retrovirus-related pol polyprotein from transposon TNT 1-94 n=1 Tax=Tanacetum coccineum TaxID=301880 RepID=A0ABQ4XPL7_9ASTR